MREIKEIHIHCSATKEGVKNNITAQEIRKWHMSEPRNWSDIGYHVVVGMGAIEGGRPLHRIPASVKSKNTNAVAVCYVGGLDANGKAKDTRTPKQKEMLIKVIKNLKKLYPKATIHGHRDFSKDKDSDGVEKHEFMKMCPCFDAEVEYMDFQPKNFKPLSKAGKDYLKNKNAK